MATSYEWCMKVIAQLIIVFVFGSVITPVSAADFVGSARGTVDRVIDGDTVKMRVAIWLDQEVLISVRVANIDAPELFRPKCEAERQLARQAKAFAETFLTDGKADLRDIERGKYAGRVVARIEVGGLDLGNAMVDAGFAYEGKKGDWCSG